MTDKVTERFFNTLVEATDMPEEIQEEARDVFYAGLATMTVVLSRPEEQREKTLEVIRVELQEWQLSKLKRM